MSKTFVPDPPTLSLVERDRRYAAIRQMMRRNGVDVLIIPPGPHRYPSDIYFTNDITGCSVVFPLESEPVLLHRGASTAGTFFQAKEWGEGVWIDDMRFGPRIPIIVEVLKERGLDKGRIGTIGALGGPNLQPAGWMPYPMVQSLKAALPEVEFVELWNDFATLWVTKSDEELALYRYVCQVAEQASQVMLDVTRVGTPETEIFARVMYEFHRHGASMAHDLFVHSGPDNLSWDAPRWFYRAQRPRLIQDGDMVLSEMMPVIGGIEAQTQMAIAVGSVHDDFLRAAEVARESYDAAIKICRAGITVGDLAEAMQEPIARAGAWHLTPHVHSITPLTLVSPVTEDLIPEVKGAFKRVDQLGGQGLDVTLEAGMTFALEPNAAFGRRQVNIGGNIIVTADGCEELNVVPCHLQFVK